MPTPRPARAVVRAVLRVCADSLTGVLRAAFRCPVRRLAVIGRVPTLTGGAPAVDLAMGVAAIEGRAAARFSTRCGEGIPVVRASAAALASSRATAVEARDSTATPVLRADAGSMEVGLGTRCTVVDVGAGAGAPALEPHPPSATATAMTDSQSEKCGYPISSSLQAVACCYLRRDAVPAQSGLTGSGCVLGARGRRHQEDPHIPQDVTGQERS